MGGELPRVCVAKPRRKLTAQQRAEKERRRQEYMTVFIRGKYGFLIRVQEGKKEGCIPLADVEIPSKTDRNYWPVREYVVWMANH